MQQLLELINGPRPYLGDIHVHSVRSDGSLSPQELGAEAQRKGLDFIGLTDHDSAPYVGIQSGVLMLPGAEFSMGDRWHMVALGENIPAPWPRRSQVPEWSCQLHKDGGALVLAHPWTVMGRNNVLKLIEEWLANGVIDGIELLNTAVRGRFFSSWLKMIELYRSRWEQYSPAILGGSDYHDQSHGGELGLGCTYIFSEGFDAVNLIKAIRERRTVAVIPQPESIKRRDYLTNLIGFFPDIIASGVGPQQWKELLLRYRSAAEAIGASSSLMAHRNGNCRRVIEIQLEGVSL
jgi:hypothetical protein